MGFPLPSGVTSCPLKLHRFPTRIDLACQPSKPTHPSTVLEMRSNLFARTHSQKAMRHLVSQGFELSTKNQRKQANPCQNWWQTEYRLSAEPQKSPTEIWPVNTSPDLGTRNLSCSCPLLWNVLECAYGASESSWGGYIFEALFYYYFPYYVFIPWKKFLYPTVTLVWESPFSKWEV